MLAFIPGTLIGLVVQPVVGVLSDHHGSRFGRRRPFIATGACLLVLFYTLLANSFSLGTSLGDVDRSEEGESKLRPAAATLVLVSFWFADFSINACQLPVRVLATDCVEHEFQVRACARAPTVLRGFRRRPRKARL